MKLSPTLLLPLCFFGLAGSLSAAVENYKIDPVHSSVGFTIRHFVSKVPGSFTAVNGMIMVDRDNLEKSSVDATIDVGSISTASEKRDTHLKSPDFFDAAKYATMTFKSKSWKKTGAETYDVTGDLTIKESTHEVVLHVTSLGFGAGGGGAQLSGWEGTTVIKKSEFGVSGPGAMAKALGDDVTVNITIEAKLAK